jgi:hypothetical protein
MHAAAVGREAVGGRWWVAAAERPAVPHRRPQPPGPGLAGGQDRDRRVVGMDPRAGADVRLDQRLQGGGDRAHPVGERRDVDRHALAAEALALPMQRQVQPELREGDLGEEVRPRPPAADRMERRRRLGDRLARPARELLAHVLEDEPARRHALERLGDVLAELAQHAPATRAL